MPVLVGIGRRWTDSTGKYSFDADLMDVKDGNVWLKKDEDGKTVVMPVEKLSQSDQDFLRKPAEQLRFARMILDIEEQADRPQEWFNVKAQLKACELDAPAENGIALVNKRIRVTSLEDKLLAEKGDFVDIARDLAKARADLELRERGGFTEKMAAIKAKMLVLEYATVSEKTQRLRHAIECLENTVLTLDYAKKLVTTQKMYEEVSTKELKDARQAAIERLEKALKSEPEWDKAKKRSLTLAERLETEKLKRSRVRRAELMEQAEKWYARKRPSK